MRTFFFQKIFLMLFLSVFLQPLFAQSDSLHWEIDIQPESSSAETHANISDKQSAALIPHYPIPF